MSNKFQVGDEVYFQDKVGREVGFHIPAVITGITTKKISGVNVTIYSSINLGDTANYSGQASQYSLRDTKGQFQGKCNRSCCLKPGATFYNRGTNAYYCYKCARLIQDANPNPSGGPLFDPEEFTRYYFAERSKREALL